MAHVQILPGLSAIASDYDALICDVWGVLHNGQKPFLEAAEALRQFRDSRGPVVLLSNAPRPVADVEDMFARLGVPLDCYDAIMTSGVATREDLARRASGRRLSMFHLGPARDRGIFDGLNIECVGVTEAELVLCSGLFDDETETPDDYAALISDLQARDITMICANPDIVVQRGGKLVYCAGAIARGYENIGGEVVYFGKPHRPIYDMSLAAAQMPKRPLAIGDALHTDIMGANRLGIDALFIAEGVHAGELETLAPERLESLFAENGVHARAAMRALVW